MIDKEKPLDVCKIEARKQIEHRIEHDSITKARAMRIVAEESDIPYNTLKQWFYPNGNDNRKSKRQKKESVCHDIQPKESVCHDIQPKESVCHDIQLEGLDKVLAMITVKELMDVVSKANVLANEVGGLSAYDILIIGIGIYNK